MAETTWCQNPKCAQKRMKHQIRGNKGNKWYQSNRASYYGGGYFCTLQCQEAWSNEFMGSALRALGILITEPKKFMLEDDWYVEYDYGRHQYYDPETDKDIYTSRGWFLKNNNRGIRQMITQEQAQTPEQMRENWNYLTINDTQARELAVTLGLAS